MTNNAVNNGIAKTNERNCSLDLLRVVSMIMIVMSHCIGHDIIPENMPTYNEFLISNVFSSLLLVHVNCFVLVSGYFLCTSEFRLSKWLKLWGTMFFWSVLLFGIMCLSGNAAFSVNELVKTVMPFTQQRYWFITTYLLMYMLIPVCNKAIAGMSKKQHLIALISFFGVFILLQNIIVWREFTSMNSRDPIFFLFLYFVAAYVRKYPFKRKYPWFLGYMLYVLLIIAVSILKMNFFIRILGYDLWSYVSFGYSSVTNVFGSVCFFMTFLQMDVKGFVGKAAVAISPLTFGVYLIHEQPNVRPFIWQELIHPYRFSDSPLFIVLIVVISLIVFVVCCCIEKVRMIIFKALKIDTLYVKIADIISKGISKIVLRAVE